MPGATEVSAVAVRIDVSATVALLPVKLAGLARVCAAVCRADRLLLTEPKAEIFACIVASFEARDTRGLLSASISLLTSPLTSRPEPIPVEERPAMMPTSCQKTLCGYYRPKKEKLKEQRLRTTFTGRIDVSCVCRTFIYAPQPMTRLDIG
ncbi:protein of unknown function [Sterolibacterium denitrificans]|uniref:Uncharacterized protein n=1 Tax=Sterolibacterium denitrificans TaxID=157592 RepID=A0A7Z7HSM7_9PROT|nr:protein of unknown function [Sterolibacterium denitrificans]